MQQADQSRPRQARMNPVAFEGFIFRTYNGSDSQGNCQQKLFKSKL